MYKGVGNGKLDHFSASVRSSLTRKIGNENVPFDWMI